MIILNVSFVELLMMNAVAGAVVRNMNFNCAPCTAWISHHYTAL